MFVYFKIFLLTLVKQSVPILISLALGGGVYYFLDSLFIATAVPLLFLLIIYIRFLGPLGYVEREKIEELVAKEVLNKLDVLITQKGDFGIRWCDNSWAGGAGLFTQFELFYESNYTVKGLYFFCKDMPYLKLHVIPWENILNIADTTLTKDPSLHIPMELSRDLILYDGGKIILPMSSSAVEYWIDNYKKVDDDD
ncbi:hypothetical protein [Paraferrimonas sp. SM1919]|uniref:hypothetical protein n=1 Tax=Paraferrimonas sp. SM1919 TaxID=2662263 RepID=UPI0013D6FFDE|nr:hypothetical protein [Paraferrimonas sp. SM1919]